VLTDVQAGPTLDGSWVAVFGNGYESKSCQARLFIVNIQTGALIKEINTNAGTCGTGKNGLGGVRLVRNANQQVIGVYAGDLLGNLWKFDLNNTSSVAWGVDLGGSPLFTGGTTQPITATPAVVALTSATAATIPAGGYMVVAGSGKFFEAGDVTNVDQQSLYGIWDPLPFGAATIPSGTALSNTSLLVPQTIGGPQVGGNNNTYFAISTNEVDYIGKTTPTVIPPKRGWYINLPNSGQRLVYPLDLLSGRIAVADSIAPTNVSSDPCANVNGGTGYLYLVDALTGAGPTVAILDTNGDGNIGIGDLIVSGLQGSADGRNATLLGEKTASKTTYFNVGGGSPGSTKIEIPCSWTNTCPPTTPTSGIKSREWRQLFMR
jgi:type IV pilus assembly protein PilY1